MYAPTRGSPYLPNLDYLGTCASNLTSYIFLPKLLRPSVSNSTRLHQTSPIQAPLETIKYKSWILMIFDYDVYDR